MTVSHKYSWWCYRDGGSNFFGGTLQNTMHITQTKDFYSFQIYSLKYWLSYLLNSPSLRFQIMLL
jgi:hypothetical protein